jgi:hypothetical protein
MAKSVRVHDDTHRALKALKVARRNASLDEVIRNMIKATTGSEPESVKAESRSEELTKFLGD